jgi:hypothetical protein
MVIERPLPPQPLHPESEDHFEQHTREAFTPVDGEPLAVWRLASALRDQEILFKTRASHSADVTDAELENLRLASQLGAAVSRIALSEPGTEAEVTIDGRTLGYPASRGEDASPGYWQTATDFALITGVREDLAPLVLTGPAYALKDGSAFASYREALHDYLRGADPGPATERAGTGRDVGAGKARGLAGCVWPSTSTPPFPKGGSATSTSSPTCWTTGVASFPKPPGGAGESWD